MERGLPDDYTVTTAVGTAVRVPSVHNSQPWRFAVGHRSLLLYADHSRQLTQTDPDGCDLMISCGAALHHARVIFAALGWHAEVHRLPSPAEPEHLASTELRRHEPILDEVALAAAIPRRRTDRRRYSSWQVPRGHLEAIAETVADEGVMVRLADDAERRTAHRDPFRPLQLPVDRTARTARRPPHPRGEGHLGRVPADGPARGLGTGQRGPVAGDSATRDRRSAAAARSRIGT